MVYLLTYSTYGTHLPGDARGSIHRHYGKLPARPGLETFAGWQMLEQPFWLNDQQDRVAVRDTIVETCQRREWRLMALHVRTTHLHGLVHAGTTTPGQVMAAWKATSTKALKGRWPDRQHFWTRGGDSRSIRDSVDAAVRYVLAGQGDPMETYVGARSS